MVRRVRGISEYGENPFQVPARFSAAVWHAARKETSQDEASINRDTRSKGIGAHIKYIRRSLSAGSSGRVSRSFIHGA